MYTDISVRKNAEMLNKQLLESEQQLTEELQVTNEELHKQGDELLKINKALTESEARYRSIIENIQDAYMRTDNEGNIIMASPSAARMYRFNSTQEMMKTTTHSYFKNSKDRDLAIEKLNKHGKYNNYEVEARRNDGTFFWVSQNAQYYYDDQGEIQGRETIVRDITEQKKAEEELIFQADILSRVQEAIIATDENLNIIYWNKMAEKILGWTKEEALGKNSGEFLQTKIDNSNRENVIEKVFKDGHFEGELYYMRKDRMYIPVELNIKRSTNENGETIGLLTSVRDISKRKESETQIRYHAYLLSQVNDAIIGTDADFKINYWNRGAEQLFGYNSDEVNSKSPLKILRADYNAGEREKLLEGLNKKGYSKSTLNLKHKNGNNIIAVQNSTRFADSSGVTIGYVVVYHDITQLKQDEEEILNHRKVLDAINEVLREYLETDSVDEVVQTCLDLAQKLTESEFGFFGEVNENGRLDDRALSPPAWDVCDTQNAHERLKNMEIVSYWGRTIKEEKSQIVNDPDSDPDRRGLPEGHPPITSFLGVPLKEGKKTIGMIALANKKTGYNETDKKNIETLGVAFVEVLLRKKAEINVAENLKNLAQSNKELEQFAYITSHDLREPLRMITSFLQLLERRYKDQLDQDANEFIDFAVNGAKRLDAMTNDLLQYSKINNNKREAIPVNFEHVLEHALENLKVQIEDHNAIITHDSLPTIVGDEELKVQLFQNIIGNAIKYRSQEIPKIHISAIKEKNQYLFSIKDNGIGMSHKHLEKIFTIFQRLHTNEEYEGTGIGLAIAQKIIHQQGGQIWAESEPGKGTTFYFTIPFKEIIKDLF